ncbi:Amino acid transporter [Arachidicoccus rhizosphaerae]|uniref:Amino acid transporter n=1 Tax=Arachidicoccus rhizosphaerae TaxID=551991 RepID=A0A1H3WA25_9BACT|nr:amino acid permease [Arachidicoccus rhizosphaerae]SDZ83264.1 Amino acid transporter [Arachidicoccus rhizosphaerae]
MSNALFRKKSIDAIQKEYDRGQEDGQPMNLKKVLTVRDLTFMGVAAVIGAGIFSTIGKAAFEGGPGVIFLFLITAVTCGFTALCYAEFASRVPVSGSAYTYSYVTFGELIAWVIGWALILEYAIGNIVVAISWSAYFNNLLIGMHIHLPDWLTIGYQTAKIKYDSAVAAGLPLGDLVYTNAPSVGPLKFIINLPAFLIVVIITILAYIGISESKKSANFMVGLKLVLLAFIVIFGFYLIIADGTSDNWSPFLPNGMDGVLRGVSSVFFAYIGFDAISTTAEECKNPRRDMPKGMLYSLLICTVIYILVALVITGLVNYKEFEGVADPLAYVFNKINMPKVGLIIAVSAVAASTSVLLVFQIGQPRIWMSMSRDGLLPKRFAQVSKRFKTPAFATLITGLLVGIPTLFIDDLLMTDLTSIGTLFAFVLVCSGVLVLPKVNKARDQFKLPYINARYIVPVLVAVFIYFFKDRLSAACANLSTESYEEILFILFIVVAIIAAVLSFIKGYSLIPVLGTLCCLYLMITIPAKSWLVFFGWMAVGLIVYFIYGYRHSRLIGKKG